MNNKFVAEIEQDPNSDDLLLVFPPELIESLGWKPGDAIGWTDNGNGGWILKRKEPDLGK